MLQPKSRGAGGGSPLNNPQGLRYTAPAGVRGQQPPVRALKPN